MQKFNFNGTEIRSIVDTDIIGKDDDSDVWFIAKEIAEILEYGKAQNLTDILDDDEISIRSYRILNDINNLDFEAPSTGLKLINESGLYHACVKSTKPVAKRFRKWVTSEVLPAIRKTGSYNMRPSYTITDTIERAQAWIEEERVRRQLELDNKQQSQKIAQDEIIIDKLENVVEEVKIELDQSQDWLSIKRVANFNRIPWQNIKWQPLKSHGIANNNPPYKVDDANYPGGVNVYHRDSWIAMRPDLKLPPKVVK
jgi:prophage antirepressor-like protein